MQTQKSKFKARTHNLCEFLFFCGATPNLNMNVENKFVYNIKHASLTMQNDKLFCHHKKYVLA